MNGLFQKNVEYLIILNKSDLIKIVNEQSPFNFNGLIDELVIKSSENSVTLSFRRVEPVEQIDD